MLKSLINSIISGMSDDRGLFQGGTEGVPLGRLGDAINSLKLQRQLGDDYDELHDPYSDYNDLDTGVSEGRRADYHIPTPIGAKMAKRVSDRDPRRHLHGVDPEYYDEYGRSEYADKEYDLYGKTEPYHKTWLDTQTNQEIPYGDPKTWKEEIGFSYDKDNPMNIEWGEGVYGDYSPAFDYYQYGEEGGYGAPGSGSSELDNQGQGWPSSTEIDELRPFDDARRRYMHGNPNWGYGNEWTWGGYRDIPSALTEPGEGIPMEWLNQLIEESSK